MQEMLNLRWEKKVILLIIGMYIQHMKFTTFFSERKFKEKKNYLGNEKLLKSTQKKQNVQYIEYGEELLER